MKRFIAAALSLSLVFGATACSSNQQETGSAAEESASTTADTANKSDGSKAQYVLKLCHEQVDGDPIDDGCDRWAELVSEKTNGAVKIEV